MLHWYSTISRPAEHPDRARLLTGALALDTLRHAGTADRDLLDAGAGLQTLATGGALELDMQGRDRAALLAAAVRRLVPPSGAVILERAKSFCNEACFTVALQHRRLKTTEPEDRVFVFRWHADLQFLIVALRRLRRAAVLAADEPAVSISLRTAIAEFDRCLPDLAKMRNVGEHIDEYVHEGTKQSRDRRQHKEVRRGGLQSSSWDGTVFNWLGVELDIDIALKAAETLFAAVSETVKRVTTTNAAP